MNSLDILATLGMRNIYGSNMFLLSFHHYSCVYELEQSPYVICLTYRTLCLNVHTTFMVRIRAKLRWRFVVPLGLPMSYACRYVGSESQGDMGSFLVHRHGARVHGNLWI